MPPLYGLKLDLTSIPVLFIFALALYIAVITLKYHKEPVYRFFGLYMLSMLVYVTGYLFQTMSVTIEMKVFWANIKVSGMCIVPATWLAASYMITQRRLPPMWLGVFSIIGAVVNLYMVWGSLNHYFRTGAELHTLSYGVTIMKPELGIWFFTGYLGYIYLLIFITMILYLYEAVQSSGSKRFMHLTQLVAIIIAVVGGLPFVTGQTHMDIFAYTIVLTSVIHYFLIHRFGFLDITKLAKDAVVNHIDAGVLVFDRLGRFVESNRKASDFIKNEKPTLKGFLNSLNLEMEEVFSFFERSVSKYVELGSAVYSLSLYIFTDDESNTAGYMLYISDITAHTRYLKMQDDIHKIEEKKVLISDIHDGIGGSISVISAISAPPFGDQESMKVSLSNINSIATETSREIRLMLNSYDRDEPTMNELTGDLRHIGNIFTEGTGIDFTHTEDINEHGETSVSFIVYINVIRLFKESVVNSVKHSEAAAIESFIAFDGNDIKLVIKDNGKGFSSDNKRGRGIKNMIKRIEGLGGDISISSEKGTSINVQISSGL
ncbi:sensor histidine kinase [Limisalsivibrio acetivorans]|uniref:sensor histidine kinase n=1 Tax=Limisalsivibrio acetivorans TaxID=1304888 RepID=UPI0003B6DF05|nr:histidine kinase N-terminal 7TM domain-containing protein [Limisalsivibrio acetivorans]